MHEDDMIKHQIERLVLFGSYSAVGDILTELLRKINKLEQEIKGLKNGNKKK